MVRVTHAAVCGTDLHLLAHPDHLPAGTVLGHEFVGTVSEVGSRVSGLAVGDRVAGADYVACGRCWWCRGSRHWHCESRRFFGTGATFGPALSGAQAELVRVPFADTVLHRLPDGLDSEAALVLGDVLATGYAAVQQAKPRPGSVVAVVGGGPVGLMAAACAQAAGAGVVVVVEPVEVRRLVASSTGSLGVTPDQAARVVRDLTDGRGADRVVDAVGGATGLNLALDVVRGRGRVVSVGVPTTEHWQLPVARAFREEVTVSFAVGDFMRDADTLVDLLMSGLVDTSSVLTERLELSAAHQAYGDMRVRTTVKAVLVL